MRAEALEMTLGKRLIKAAEEARSIAAARLVMTDRAGRWVTEQVGRWGRTVNEVAVELGCDWHTINDDRARLRHRARR